MSMADAWTALREIQALVHTPTKKTPHKSASDHYASDFEQIRKICAKVVGERS